MTTAQRIDAAIEGKSTKDERAMTEKAQAAITGMKETEAKPMCLGYVWVQDQRRPVSKIEMLVDGRHAGLYRATVGKDVGSVIVPLTSISPAAGFTMLDLIEVGRNNSITGCKDTAETFKERKNTMSDQTTEKKAKAKSKKDNGIDPNIMVEHLGYSGETEVVQKKKYCNEIKCEICNMTRHVANADLFQVKLCKPCKKSAARRTAMNKATTPAAKKAVHEAWLRGELRVEAQEPKAPAPKTEAPKTEAPKTEAPKTNKKTAAKK